MCMEIVFALEQSFPRAYGSIRREGPEMIYREFSLIDQRVKYIYRERIVASAEGGNEVRLEVPNRALRLIIPMIFGRHISSFLNNPSEKSFDVSLSMTCTFI